MKPLYTFWGILSKFSMLWALRARFNALFPFGGLFVTLICLPVFPACRFPLTIRLVFCGLTSQARRSVAKFTSFAFAVRSCTTETGCMCFKGMHLLSSIAHFSLKSEQVFLYAKMYRVYESY